MANTKKLIKSLETLLIAGRNLLKRSNEILELEFGEAVQKKAEEAAAALVEAYLVEPQDKGRLVDALVHNKTAVLTDFGKLAKQYGIRDLGRPEVKGASKPELPESELEWNKDWGFGN